jgi:hypothetical protein
VLSHFFFVICVNQVPFIYTQSGVINEEKHLNDACDQSNFSRSATVKLCDWSCRQTHSCYGQAQVGTDQKKSVYLPEACCEKMVDGTAKASAAPKAEQKS